ncbi:hypothetical protein GJAV_G00093240 [Gymnothorax javanicus]|nr:hypothetical protein GJAV_G00093240 [Gymnothorax javanicus]
MYRGSDQCWNWGAGAGFGRGVDVEPAIVLVLLSGKEIRETQALQCHCLHCPNSTCVTDGLCYVFMKKSGNKYTPGYGMCLKKKDLYPPDRPFVCAPSSGDNTGIYPLCCDEDFCNKDPDPDAFTDDSLPSSPPRQLQLYTDNDGDSIPSSTEPPWPISTGDGDQREAMPTWAKNINAILEVLLRKVETIEQNQREALLLLRANRRGDPGEATVELQQAQTQAKLANLEEHLQNITKKMISHLSLVCGSNPGKRVRRVLRSVAPNYVRSSYSLRGKEGKLPLLGTAVGSAIKQAIMKWKPGLEEKEVELLIADFLKHAPSAHSNGLKGRMERQVEEHPQN